MNKLFQDIKFNKIHVWSGERDDNVIQFMYKPVFNTITKLLKSSFDNIDIDYQCGNCNYNNLLSNDILIFVGCISIPNFEELKKKNIYTVFYETEPVPIFITSNDEVWIYSKKLFDTYSKKSSNQIIKFVPIICEENIPFVPYSNNNKVELTFLGYINARQNKQNIIFKNSALKNNFKEVYNLWSDEKYNNYISNNNDIYLNLTKSGTNILPSVRINKLLSHKCIIISEHTNPIDEEYYKGMVYFCNINEIGNIFQTLSNKTGIELQKEADEKYKLFYNKFNINYNSLICEK